MDSVGLAIDIFEENSEWKYKVFLNKNKKPIQQVVGFISYDSALQDAITFSENYIANINPPQSGISWNANPYVVALAEQEALAAQEASQEKEQAFQGVQE